MRKRKLLVVGDSVFAQLAYEFFTYDSAYEVVAFSVEQAYRKRARLCGLPLVPFETVETLYPPAEHHVFVAVVFTQQNRLRTRLYEAAKAKGYRAASYISSQALVAATAEVGEHCFICEATIVHPGARIGDNVILWSGNLVGHHAVVQNNCFTLPHAVVGESAELGANCVLGPNATLAAHVKVAADCHIEAGALVADNSG